MAETNVFCKGKKMSQEVIQITQEIADFTAAGRKIKFLILVLTSEPGQAGTKNKFTAAKSISVTTSSRGSLIIDSS